MNQTGGQPLSLESCYRALQRGGADGVRAKELLGRRHWIHEASDFDERSGEMLPERLGRACERLSRVSANASSLGARDRFHRILEHVRQPLTEILHKLREGLTRQHVSLPLRSVRELDTASFFALSRRPGRTVREKLADRPYLWAVERRWTVDTPENRLVKAFCLGVSDLLRLREGLLEPEFDDLRALVDAWLLAPVAGEIGRWENLPPNNLLLQHRDYRRVWNAWSWTETLDEDIRRDRERQVPQWATMVFWSIVARLSARPDVRVVEQACYFDYEAFSIVPGRTPDGSLALADGLVGVLPGAGAGKPFSLELRADGEGVARIALRTTGTTTPVEIACKLVVDRVKVRVGARVTACDPTAEAALDLAAAFVNATFGPQETAPPRPPTPPATARSALCVVDPCSLRPRFATEGDKGLLPFRLLWQNWRQPGREPFSFGLGAARAVALGDADVDTVSVLDMLDAEPRHTASTLAQAASAFASSLRDALPTASLIYLVPDGTDEFTLGTLRRSINGAFRSARPLPRSIAAAFEWQSSPRFAAARVRDGDRLVIFDTVGERLTATPLVAAWSDELARRVPESRGIGWERCPCIVGGPESTSVATAVHCLEEMGCPFPEAIARLCGFQGLVDEGRGLSWQDSSGVWFTVPHEREQAFRRSTAALVDPWRPLAAGLERELSTLPRGARVLALFAGDVWCVTNPRIETGRRGGPEVVSVGAAREPHAGALELQRWQERAGDVPLWYDRLPELSMRIIEQGGYARFYLVRKAKVDPRPGVPVTIPIKERFVLDAGKHNYRFPLLQGADGGELRYEAFLASPVLPLAEDVPVELELTYRYGTDTPYDLVFTNRERGLRLRAEWRQRDESSLPSHYPTPPSAESWTRFEQYPKRGTEETRSLLDWIRDNLERVQRHIGTLRVGRQSATASSAWRVDRNNKRYTSARSQAGSVFVHEADFVFPEQADEVENRTVLRMEIEPTDKGLIGRWITLGSGDDVDHDWLLCQKLDRLADAMKKGPRFPFLTVWADGHSLDEVDAPDAFRQYMRGAAQMLVSLREKLPDPESSGELARRVRRVSDEALFLLCCMHRDAPVEAVAALREAIAAEGSDAWKPWRYGRHVALALGACELDWQRELLRDVLAVLQRERVPLDESGPRLQILGVALWQCPALLVQIAEPDLRRVLDQAIFILGQDLARLSANASGVAPWALKDHLELVLALLRTRASEDATIRGLLAPGKRAAKDLARIVERIIDIVSERDIPIESRVDLLLQKPEVLHGTPDLLYALKLYLTGDDGAAAIQVMAVERDEGRGLG